MFRRLLFGFALALLTVPASAQESLLDVVLKRDKLIVATYSTSPPLAYVDESGNLVGFEIDMAREIAKDLLGDPNKVEFVVVQSDGRFPAALSGKIDFGLCSTTITPDRAVRIAFTRPYLDTAGSVIAPQGRRDQARQGAQRPQIHLRRSQRSAGDRSGQVGAAQCQAAVARFAIGALSCG